MKVAKNILELIGNTPLVQINELNKDGYAKVYAKLEAFNPCSSIKDRTALSMIETAEKEGKLIPHKTTIIEPTSGNTGVGLAFICAVKGYKLILTMPETMSIERRLMVKAFGAEVILTDGTKGMKGAIDKANELASKIENSFIPQQFDNPANPEIHRLTTAEEIYNDTDGQVDIIVAGVGTGGTLMGIAQNLKEKNKNIMSVAIEPQNSAVLSGEKAGMHGLQGIGAGFIPSICDTNLIDKVIKVSDEDAINCARELATKEGILCGISGGASMFGALGMSKQLENKDKTIVVILPDFGERYLSTALFKDLI